MSLKGKIKDIADSLRETLGTNVKYTLSQMPPLIRSLNFKYKTDDIYYNFFKFDCSKYGDAIIFNSHMNFYNDINNTENRYKKQNLITKRGTNSHYYYDRETEFSDSLHSIFPVNPDVYEYQYGDTYYDFSSNTFEYAFYPTFHFCNYNKTSEPFDKIVLSQHFLINFEDSEKTYSVGLGITSNSSYYDYSYYNKTAGCYSKFFWLSIEASKLYATVGINNKNAETFKDYICDLEPETDLDISVELDYTDEDLTNNNFSNIFNYKITINSTEYTGTLTHTWTDSFLQGNSRYNNRPFGITTLKDTPEKLRWYSMEMKGRRFTNVLINPIVSFAEGRLFEITDENSPGLKNIHAKCINLCTNPAFKTLDNSSVEIIEPYAFQAETTDNYSFYMQLEKINLPACKTIGNYAFGGLSNRWSTIAELNIPNVEKIGTGAFQYSLRKMHGTLALNKVTSIGNSAFLQAGFSKISLPLITTLGTSTFENCQNLEEIDMPLLETITGNYCFKSCSALRKIRMPNLKTAGYQSFAYKRCHYTTEDFYFPSLETLDNGAFAYSNFGPRGKINFLPNVKTIASSTFQACVCEEIELPELLTSSSGGAAFYNIKNLKKLRLPKVNGRFGYFFRDITYKSDDFTFDMDLIAPNLSYYSYSMFDGAFFAIFKSSYLTIPDAPYYGVFGNSWITQAYIKNLNYINDRFFYQAYNLEIAYFDSAYTIGKTNYYAEHFRQCLNLKALILAGDETVCSLIDQNAFYQTPFAPLENQPIANDIKQKREGYIYVPRALLESYKTTANWSYYADSFRAIEDYGGLEGIKKLIHPDYANTVNLTNSQLVSDIQNPLRSKVLSSELDVTISNTVNGVDCSTFGDNNQYVVMKRLNSTIYRNLVLLSLPAVKDFEVEFDMVASSSYNATFWFGFKKLPETVEEFTNANVCQPYTYGIHFRLSFGENARVDNRSASYHYNGCWFTREAGISQLYSDNGGFYAYEKIHIRIVRQGRVFKRYMNEILTAQAEFDGIQHCPGGFLGIELQESYTVGITNFVLKYDNTWYDPLSNEIWISSVRLPNLTANIDGVDRVLSKNEFGYYVFDVTNVTDLMDVKMFSDNTQISDLSTKITQFSGKILCITDNEQVTYN